MDDFPKGFIRSINTSGPKVSASGPKRMLTGTVSPGKALTKKLPQRAAAKAKACSRWGPRRGSLKPTPGPSSTWNVTFTGSAWVPGSPSPTTRASATTLDTTNFDQVAYRCRTVITRLLSYSA